MTASGSGIFAERGPQADALGIGGEGALGVDRGRARRGGEQQCDHHKSLLECQSLRGGRRKRSVLRIRQAMVIGPTPPGTGVIAPATSLADVEIDIADQSALAAVSAG